MLQFFRKLRRQEMKGTKYLKYALGEIFLVVIGILIALSINNWNDQRKIKNTSLKTIKDLQEEVRNAIKQTEPVLNFNTINSEDVNEYLYQQSGETPHDSIKSSVVFRALTFAPMTLSIPILQNELTQDNKIIDAPELLVRLREILDLKSRLEQLNELVDRNWSTNVIDFLNEQNASIVFYKIAKDMSQHNHELSVLYDNEEFKNIISFQQSGKDQHNRFLKLLREKLTELDKWLEKRID